jgi:hypothetical protein
VFGGVFLVQRGREDKDPSVSRGCVTVGTERESLPECLTRRSEAPGEYRGMVESVN